MEVRHGSSRLIVDVGMPLMWNDGSEVDGGKYEGLTGPELIAAGILPNVDGLYAWQQPTVDAVLLSHAHQDHYGLVNHVHPVIPVYLGGGTQKLIEVTSQFTPTKIELHKPVVFDWPGSFTAGAFRVTPHLVDHSCFGAFAFEVEAAGKRVFYSGDFRDHGNIGQTLDIIAKRCKDGVDALVMEGTMFGRDREQVLTEQELADEAKTICKETPGAVLVYQSGQNVSRAVSFYKAARASGREFVLDFYTAHVLAELGKVKGGGSLPFPGSLPDIRVWYPWFLTERLMRSGNADIPSRYAQWKMTKEEISANPRNVLMFVRPGMEGDLERIHGLDGSVLLYSLWSGYRDKPAIKKLFDTCERLGIAECQLHTSGHATQEAMKRLLNAVQPKCVIPIHTRHPERYVNLMYPVKELRDGEAFEL